MSVTLTVLAVIYVLIGCIFVGAAFDEDKKSIDLTNCAFLILLWPLLFAMGIGSYLAKKVGK